MAKKQKQAPESIELNMVVETTEGDLGEEDVSKPLVADVIEDQQGRVEKVVVEKGVVFKKKLKIPAERVQSVEAVSGDGQTSGKVMIDVSQAEAKELAPLGDEELSPETEDEETLLEEVEKNIPTVQGLRRMEAAHAVMRERGKDSGLDEAVEKPAPWLPGERPEQATREIEGENALSLTRPASLLRVLGPGFLAGMAGNDSSAVTAYSIDGATNGYGHLWLLLLSTPLYHAVQFACAKIGRITQQGLADILREHYGRWVAMLVTLVLITANIALIAADIVAVGSGLELITGLSWRWFVVPVAALLWYLTVFRSFEAIKKIFIVMSLAFVTYIVTALFSGANWGAVLFQTFVPHVQFSFASISSAVALLGATISPYTMFWQVQGEKEEQRPGTFKQQMRIATLDIASGVISGNAVSYFIIICTSATIFMHHEQITTAADAAKALVPLVGPLAKYLFALGLIGAGLVAIPVLLASTSYAVAGTFGWPAGLSKKPWQNEGFYLILTAALIIGLVVALLHLDPIQLIFWANVLAGVLSPILVVTLIVVGNNHTIMRNRRFSVVTTICLVVTALVMVAAAVLLFYGLATGQSG